MQRHSVHCSGHRMLAHAVMDIAAVPALRRHRRGMAGLGVVRTRQVSRAADHFRHEVRDHFQCLAAPGAGRFGGAAFGNRLLVLDDGLAEILWQAARDGRVEFALLGAGRETLLPFGMLVMTALTGLGPGLFDRFRHIERLMRPAERLADAGNLFSPVRSAMCLASAGQFRGAKADDRLHRQENRLLLLGRPFQGLSDIFLVMPVHAAADPARCLEACTLVGRI